MKIAVYPGSFDPVTLGHLDVIRRSAKLVDKLIIGVLNNGKKTPLFTADERVDMIKQVTKDIPNLEVESFDGLLIEYARIKKAQAIVRGLRAVTDFEYELQLAQTNHKLNPNVDTMFLTTSVEYAYVSSSIVKEVAMYGGDISGFVAKEIAPIIYAKFQNME
ncbi:pantetheine-phosphate adenylyltransferase [Anaerolentibacter hominis]|uniref:pantetheine-phosphate adenylyltransferase n=1 Tax=Anaerolentibacter hominis TaxID=3079009 RepID=UPI0031B871F7